MAASTQKNAAHSARSRANTQRISASHGVRVRIAPSPTGPFHIGTARTALFNWIFAHQGKGIFILRIEDTDADRSEKKYECEIFEGLKWLGIDWSEGPDSYGGKDKGSYGPYRQSERGAIYREHLEKLLETKKAYLCYCTKEELESERQFMLSQGLPPKYGGHCRNLEAPPAGRDPQVMRFKTPEKKIEFKDMIRGKVVFDAALFGDMVIARIERGGNDLSYHPLYNFVVVVDDSLMKISHVIRGEDHLSNTPKQILIGEAFGFDQPFYAHLPLILNPDRSKMSKRFSDTALLEYKEKGYLPEAIINFLALLGWHPKDDRELLTREEIADEFDIARVQKGGAIFNEEKLDWLNAEYIKRMDDDEFIEFVFPHSSSGGKITPLVRSALLANRSRFKTIAELKAGIKFYSELPDYTGDILVPSNATVGETSASLVEIERRLSAIPESAWGGAAIRNYLEELSQKSGRGSVYWPFRVALSGSKVSPDPVEIAEILGKDESIRRIKVAIKKLG